MKKSLITTHLGMVIIAFLPILYLAIVWNTVPDRVPLHFNGEFQPDRIGNKSELWLVSGLISLVSTGVYFLLRNIQRIDPKRRGAPQSNIFNRLATGIVIFTTAINFILLIASIKGTGLITNFMFPLMGLLFAFIGNYMNNIKPNYFAGIRLPWTLNDDDNWRRTHHMASKLWFCGGLGIALLSLFLPLSIMIYVFIGIAVIITLIPAVYSYWLFKNKN